MDPTRIDGRYRVLSELGSGGMGAVFKVEDETSGRILALKVLASEGERQRDRLLRFRREFRAASALSHPNIVRVFDFVSGRVSYFTMEYVEGRNAAEYFGVGDRMARPPRPEDLNRPERVRRLFAVLHQVLLALGYMHDRAIVHRDLKPENIVVGEVPDPEQPERRVPLVTLMDFGLARDLRDTTNLTQPGVVLGTLSYLSPEQATGRTVDGRADLYALGVVLYLLLTGTLPFATDTVSSILWKHCAESPAAPRLRNPGVNRFLESVCSRCLRKDPFERFQTAGEVLRGLERTGRSTYTLPAAVVEAVARGERSTGQIFVPRLVGREEVLGRLSERLEEAAHGRGGVVWLEGESGIGKSRLLAEAADLARGLEVAVLAARFHPADPRPYGAFATLIEDLLPGLRGLSREEAARVLGPGARTLADLVPALADLEALRQIPPGPPLTGERRRRALGEAMGRLVHGLWRRAPLLVTLDDVHHADELALGLIGWLAAGSEPGEGTPPEGAGLLLVLAGEGREPRAEWKASQIALGRLGEAHGTLLVQSMLGQELTGDAGCAEALYRASGGNPWLHEEMTRELVAEGGIYREGGRWQVDPGRLRLGADAAAPGSDAGARVTAAWRQRIDRLGQPARDLAEMLALLGRDAGFELLHVAAGLEEGTAIDAVEELLRGRVLVETRGGSELGFLHERVRAVVLDQLEAARRPAVHRRLLDGLERIHAGRLAEHVVELAHHAREAGDPEKASAYPTAAAARLRELGAA